MNTEKAVERVKWAAILPLWAAALVLLCAVGIATADDHTAVHPMVIFKSMPVL